MRFPQRALLDARALGADCANCPLSGEKPVRPRPSTAGSTLLAIVSEAPNESETSAGLALGGRGGLLLTEGLQRIEVPVQAVHVTTAVLCRPGFRLGAADYTKAVNCCRPRLARELLHAGVHTALLLGSKAQQAVMGKASVLDWMGAPDRGAIFKPSGAVWTPLKKTPLPPPETLRFDQLATLSSYSLGFVLSAPAHTPVFAKHLQRAVSLAKGELPAWVWASREIIDHGEEMDRAFDYLLHSGAELGVDIETNMDAANRKLLNVGIASYSTAVSITWELADSKTRELVRQVLATENTKVFWNMAFDVPILAAFGLPVGGRIEDWMLAKRLLAPGISSKLTHASCFELAVPRWKTNFRAGAQEGLDAFESADPAERALYNLRDTWVTLLLGKPYRAQLKELHNGEQLYANALANTRLAIKMGQTGIKLNAANREKLSVDYTGKLTHAKATVRQHADILGLPAFNERSHPQRLLLFRDKLGVNIPRNKLGKHSLDKKVLEDFCMSDDKRVATLARAMLNSRAAEKKLNYIESLKGEYARPQWQPGKAKTGRWASSVPNLMNIPKPIKDAQTKVIIDPGLRLLFDARPGLELVEVDYSALEARILALIVGDKLLLEWFASGVDVHTRTAALVLGIEDSAVSSGSREVAKQLRYAFHYGSVPETAWRQTVIKLPSLTLHQVDTLFGGLRRLHPAIHAYHEQVVADAKRLDYIQCALSGRRHYFHGQVEVNQCYNLPIQMAASYLIDDAMQRLASQLEGEEAILMQVHDSLLCEGPDAGRLHAKVKSAMEAPVTLNGHTISFLTDGKHGVNWGLMSHI